MKRRGNQEGSLTLRKDGLWAARVSHEGKRIAVYGKTKEEARLKLRPLQRKQDQGLPLVTSNMSLQDYLTQWLDTITHRIRPKTLADYDAIVRCHLIPRLGHVRLGKLGPEHVQKAWNDMLREDKSPGPGGALPHAPVQSSERRRTAPVHLPQLLPSGLPTQGSHEGARPAGRPGCPTDP